MLIDIKVRISTPKQVYFVNFLVIIFYTIIIILHLKQ